jgi:hypothetical protein
LQASPAIRGRRRPWLLALGITLAILGALAGFWMVSAAGDRVPVLALARDVPFGTTITERDLRVVDVAVGVDLDTVAADRLGDVAGLSAATSLPAGSLLSEQALTAAAPPEAGEVLLGVAVPSGRMPTSPLLPGDSVLVVETPANEAEAATSPPRTFRVSLVRVAEPDVNGVIVLDVTVDQGDGPALAALAATGRVAVVIEPRTTAP